MQLFVFSILKDDQQLFLYGNFAMGAMDFTILLYHWIVLNSCQVPIKLALKSPNAYTFLLRNIAFIPFLYDNYNIIRSILQHLLFFKCLMIWYKLVMFIWTEICISDIEFIAEICTELS